MDGTKSLSQGVFLSLPPGYNLSKLRRRKNRKKSDDDNLELWEQSFLEIWRKIDSKVTKISENAYSKVLNDLVQHIEKLASLKNEPGTIPCELLLTGMNLPDHKLLLSSLSRKLNDAVTSNVAILWSSESGTLKNIVQSLVKQIVYRQDESSESEDFDDDDELVERPKPSAQLSMATLAAWHKEDQKPIVVVIPDFESFAAGIVSDLISLLCAYESTVPVILILGVATTPTAVYQILPRSVMTRLIIQQFKSEPSPNFLNHIIETILLSDVCPFRLGSRTMTFLTDLFLFNSFSVQRFVQGFKYCMMEHFFRKREMVLCCEESQLEAKISSLSPETVEKIRRLSSFRNHVEKSDLEERKKLLLDNEYAKKFIVENLTFLSQYISDFHVVLKCLTLLVRDLPGAPLGRSVREIYCRAVSNSIKTDNDFKHALALIGVLSKTELATKIATVIELLKTSEKTFKTVIEKLESNLTNCDLFNILSKYLLEPFLQSPAEFPLYEIFYFDDLPAVRRRISGAPRSAIHNALNNPQTYLECDCCQLDNLDAVTSTLPDISIAYKIYLESNKTINLYDWLQSFSAVIESGTAENGDTSKQLQARFTRAVSELQFLGFIKPSRAKPDFVTRLTFGNF